MSDTVPASFYGPSVRPGGAPTSISAPMPLAAPPAPLGTVAAAIHSPQCWRCGRTLAEYLTPPYSLRCHRCKAPNRVPVHPEASTN